MTTESSWREIVASSLDWKQAHAGFEAAIEGLAAADRGRRPDGYPHSIWELVEHIRIAQRDLLEFMVSAQYHEMKWPDDYWPASPEPPSDAAWDEIIAAVKRDRAALANFTRSFPGDLTSKIPRGSGQTYLRTVLVAVDHAAFHVGQIVAVRRLLQDWPAS